MRPTIALCIPAFNATSFIDKLLQSAQNQSIPFDEILVYDDCSTDDTEVIAIKHGATVIRGRKNRGCSFGKNKLASIAKADWLHFHDADDLLLPNFTSEMHLWIANESTSFDALLLNFNYIDFETKKLLGSANHTQKQIEEDSLKYILSHKTVNFGLYRRLAFLNAGGFDLDSNVLYNEDNAFHISLAKFGLKFDYLETITCINYRYKNSMSASNQLNCARSNYHVLEKVAISHGKLYPKEINDQIWNCIASLSVFEDWDYIKKALKLSEYTSIKSCNNGNSLFNLSSKIQPFLAIWLREKFIRLFKPYLRVYL